MAEPGSAHWVQVDERSGAAGVEAAAITAVKQLQASGVNVAKDLQVCALLRLCSRAQQWHLNQQQNVVGVETADIICFCCEQGNGICGRIALATRIFAAVRHPDADRRDLECRCSRP